jgi:hypothetical protein
MYAIYTHFGLFSYRLETMVLQLHKDHIGVCHVPMPGTKEDEKLIDVIWRSDSLRMTAWKIQTNMPSEVCGVI